jgi:hypothetical protein
MRKIYMTLALTMAFVWASAQSFQSGPVLNTSATQKTALMKLVKAKKAENTKSISHRWYSYASTIDDALGNIGDLNLAYLFPDTNVLVMYGTTADKPWIHSAAIIVDPTSDWFEKNGEQKITDNDSYTLDSALILCGYTRNTSSSIVDTLRFEFFTTNDHQYFPIYKFTSSWVMTNYGADTLYFVGIKRTDLVLDDPQKVVVDVLLHESDTASINGWNVFQAGPATPLQVAAGEAGGVTVKFIPGFTYSATDTLNSMGNYIIFASLEENGDDTYPSYTKRDWNTSQIVPSWATQAGSNWKTIYVPEWAFVQGYGFENHLIDVLYTADVGFTGIEQAQNSGLSVSQNQPNPFSGTTLVNYTLDKAANITIDVYNVAGAKVMSIGQGTQAAGSHSVQIDASDLQAGIYYYTITADNYSVTKKMVVY